MKIYTKILLTTLPLVLIPLLIAAGTIYFYSHQSLMSLGENWMKSRLDEVVNVANTFKEKAIKFGLDDSEACMEQVRLDAMDAMQAVKVSNGYVFVVSSQGKIIAHRDPSLIGTDLNREKWFQDISKDKKAARSEHGPREKFWSRMSAISYRLSALSFNLSTKSSKLSAFSSQNTNYLAMYEYFHPWRWHIFVANPENEVYGSVNQVKYYVVLLAILGLLVGALGLMVLTRKLTAPLHLLTDGAEQIREGELDDVHIPILTRDEFGDLADAFNRMVGQLRQTLTALQKKEEHFRSLIENASDIITILNDDGYIRYESPSTRRILGYQSEELLNKQIYDFIHPDDLPQAMRIFTEISRNPGSIRAAEFRFQHKEGPWCVFECIANKPVQDSEFRGTIVNWREITERSQVQEQMQKAKELAESANQAKSGFLANMSHELRTPLNAIIGYSEMLMEDAEDMGDEATLEEAVPDLKKIHIAGKHLLALINDILDLSKIEAGKMELYSETFNVPELVQDVVSTIQPLVEKNANTLEVYCADDIRNMFADMTKIRQALFNLLSNACKFTEQGTITLTVIRETSQALETSVSDKEGKTLLAFNGDAPGIGVSDQGMFTLNPPKEKTSQISETSKGLSDHEEWFIFTVSDTGIGITPEQMEKLFQAFSQADASTTRKFGGTGLGLLITKRFSEMMGGEITVESEYGKGTTFTIRLPAKTDEAPPEPEKSLKLPEPVPEGSCTVLVIDDDPNVCDMMKRFLSKEGFRVETVSGGKEGLRFAREFRPDAITLDVMMPGMDGWSVLTQIKTDPELADIPVIMLTIADNKNMGYALGASDYMTKPVDRDRLVSVLQKYGDAVRTDSKLSDKPLRVLVVEDDPAAREMLQRMLNQEKWTVTEAENGRVALEQVANARPDMILLDLMMPEMDGFQFVSELRSHEDWRSIPIVVITAKEITSEDRQRLNGYVQKILQKGAYSRQGLLNEVRDMVSLGVCKTEPS